MFGLFGKVKIMMAGCVVKYDSVQRKVVPHQWMRPQWRECTSAVEEFELREWCVITDHLGAAGNVGQKPLCPLNAPQMKI